MNAKGDGGEKGEEEKEERNVRFARFLLIRRFKFEQHWKEYIQRKIFIGYYSE